MIYDSPRSKPGSRAAIYVRVSSRGQADDGNGADVQKKNCLEIIRRNKWELYEIYFNDKGVSGEVEPTKRPEFMKMINDGLNKKFTIVVVSNLDRLARTILNMELAKNLIYEAKLKIFAGTEFCEDTLIGKLNSGITGVIAEFEKGQLVVRMRKGLEESKAERGVTQGKLPFGYKKVGKAKKTKITINDYEAKTINIIYDMRENGNTLQSIAEFLNSQEIKAPKSDKWDHKKVSQLLTMGKREIYCGGLRNRGNRLEVRWPQILPDKYKITEEELQQYEKQTNSAVVIPKIKCTLTEMKPYKSSYDESSVSLLPIKINETKEEINTEKPTKKSTLIPI